MKLDAVIKEILCSLRDAQHLGNLETLELNEKYEKNGRLKHMSIPSFKISEIELELHFNFSGSEKKDGKNESNLEIEIAANELSKLESYQIQTAKFKINPLNLRVFEEEPEDT